MTEKKYSELGLFVTTMLILAFIWLPGLSFADIYILPCTYRTEINSDDVVRADQARVGYYSAPGVLWHYRTWAEFDISALEGKTVSGVCLMVYNDWAGTRISQLLYSSLRPSDDPYLMNSQYVGTNIYGGFDWTINANDAWSPENGFFCPSEEEWEAWKRDPGGANISLLGDLQAHADDPAKSWFAVGFAHMGEPTANLRFGSDVYNPASIIMAVITESDFDKEKNQGACTSSCDVCPAGGKPINFSTGNEYYPDEDFMLPGPGLPMGFARHYNSQSEESGYLGYGWTGSWSEHITVETGKIILHGADGNETHFAENGQGEYLSEADTVRIIVPDGSGGHLLREPDGKVFSFDAAGNLKQIRDRNGNTQTVTYANGKPVSVDDNFGRQLGFSYNAGGFLQTLTTPAGDFTYTYDAQGNLTGVTKPDTTGKIYRYTDANDPHNLTEVEDENGVICRLSYDDQDRAVFSGFADGTDGITVDYQDGMTRKITDSLGRETNFELQAGNGIGRVKSVSGTGCGSCYSPSGGSYAMNDRLRTTQKADAEGNITKYSYDTRGNILIKTDAFGTPHERSVAYAWHSDYSFVTSVTRGSVANPGQDIVTNFSYDTTGNLLQKTENGYSGTTPISRTTGFSYNSQGQITGIDGPRTDVSDTLIFEYYPNDAGQGSDRGMLKKITDGAGHETLFSQYNAWGKPGQVTDENDVPTTFAYDAMGRMTSKSSAGLTATYDYDDAGNLTVVSLPGSRTITYAYTDAGLLEKIGDTEGNYLKYSYDTEGNRLREEIHDRNDVLRQFGDYEPDDYNRLKKIIHPGGAYEEFSYDGNDSLTQTRDAKGNITAYAYDALNRLTGVTQPGNRITAYGYDSHDNLGSVTDAESNATTYAYDDFGREVSAVSQDTGTTSYQYDVADNVVSKTDANGITVAYQYDVLNRLTGMYFPDSSQNISFGYDAGTYGKGKLTSVSDPAGTTSYSYNSRGQLTQETRIADGVTYVTQYLYDSGTGDLSGMVCPSGMTLTYQRDTNGQISGITADGQDVTKSVAYLPFGSAESLTLGNDILNVSKSFDSRYFLTRIQAGTLLDYQYTHDANGNVLTISGISKPSLSPGTTDYLHAVGNRLTQSTGAVAKVYSHDNHGNIISDGTRTFVYNQNNRLIRVEEGATVLGEYFYDAFGRRVKKIASGITTVYHYDVAGNLIAETQADGTSLRDIVYMNGERVAMKLYGSQAGWYYFLNDHLGTPQKIVDSSGTVVWAGFYLPFGKAWAYPATITNNFRFPGQYYDAETGLHYNWHRYYDPDTGRYITADPIGLEGGVNLYAYVMNSPSNLTDPEGLYVKALGMLIQKCLSSEPCRKAIMTGVTATLAGLEATITSLMGKGKKKGKNPCKDESTPDMPPDDDDDLADKPSKIADKLGRSRKEVRDAIHKVKENMYRGGPNRNPDVWVDIRSGEVYPKTPGGGVGDSIGNIFDYLP